MSLCLGFFVLLLVGTLAYAFFVIRPKEKKAVKTLQGQYNLTASKGNVPGFTALDGVHNGHKIALKRTENSYKVQDPHDKRRLKTAYSAEAPQLAIDFKTRLTQRIVVTPDSPFMTTSYDLKSKLAGLKEMRVGDESFDDAFNVYGKDHAHICDLLNPATRAALLAFKSRFGKNFVLDQHGVLKTRVEQSMVVALTEDMLAVVKAIEASQQEMLFQDTASTEDA